MFFNNHCSCEQNRVVCRPADCANSRPCCDLACRCSDRCRDKGDYDKCGYDKPRCNCKCGCDKCDHDKGDYDKCGCGNDGYDKPRCGCKCCKFCCCSECRCCERRNSYND